MTADVAPAHAGVTRWDDRQEGPLSGAYSGMPELLYHRHEALSSSGAKKLTKPSTPAHFRQWRDAPQKPKKEFDIGSAAHTVVLGTGRPLHVVEAGSWVTKAAKEERELGRELGRIPVLEKEYEEVQAMADEIRRHPLASLLFQRQQWEAGQLIEATGTAEVSLFWRDEVLGVDKRCRLDWLPSRLTVEGVLMVPDYKTCASAAPDAIARSVRDYRYHQQAEWNTDGVLACGLSGGAPVVFVFVFQEKTAPYLINVKAVERQSLQVAGWRNGQAMRLFRECSESGSWPGYPEKIEEIQLPYWDLARELEEMQL